MPQLNSDQVLRWLPCALAAIALRDLVTSPGLPAPALAWTAFAFLAYVSLAITLARGTGWGAPAAVLLSAASVVVTSMNPSDPYYLTNWDDPVASISVLLEGYALPIPLGVLALRDVLRGGATRSAPSPKR